MAHFETNVEYGKCPFEMTEEELEAQHSEIEKQLLDSFRSGNLYIDEHHEYSQHIPFLLTPYAAKMPEVLDHMNKKWVLSIPRIVLFVFSECQSFCSDDYRKISKKLSKGLAFALNTTEMWLFTAGIDAGFSKDIGKEVESQFSRRRSIEEGVQKSRSSFPDVALIGICEKNALKCAYKFQSGEVIEPTDPEEKTCPKVDINRNFGYFIIVEDTTTTRRGVSRFILNFTDYLIQQPGKRAGDKLPVMTILLNGKLSHVDTVLGMLKLELPVIVLEGSGGLADMLAFAFYQNASCPEGIDRAVYSESVLKPQVVTKINLHYPSLPEDEVTRVSGKIFDCIRKSSKKNQQFLTVLNLNAVGYEPSKLPHLLLKALFKAQKAPEIVTAEELKARLILTMEWNSVDVALDEVFSLDRSSTFQVDDDLFFKALTKPNREEFVAVYLSKGFNVHTFLNSSTLLNLFQYSLTREFFRSVVWESVLGFGTNADITRSFLDSKLIILIEELTGIPSLLNSYELDWNSRRIYDDRSPPEAERKAMTVLVMWAILSHRVKLVKVLIRHSQQPIHLALACFIILRKLEPYVSDLTLKKEMIEQAVEFSEMASDIMTLCYESVPCRALDVLNEKNRVWSYRALMELAAFAKNKMFLAHPCCQKYLDNQFMGRLKIRDLPYGDITVPMWLKILFSAFFVFPMFIWIRFEPPKQKRSVKDSSSGKHQDDKSQGDGADPLSQEEIAAQEKQANKKEEPSFFEKIYYLWTAPITKFWVFMVFYCLFLAFFSLAVIWPGCGNLFLDFFACIWIGSFIMDAIYQAYILNKKYSSMPLAYRSLEIAFMIIFLFSYVMGRLVYMQNFMSSYSVKVMLCFALLYSYYRLIFVSLPISSELGPLLYRVKRMVRVDFIGYIRVTILIVISNGLVMHSVMFPEWPLGWELLRRAFFDAFISFFLAPLADKFGEPDKKCVPLKRRPDGKSFYGFDPDECRVSRYFKHECNNPGVWAYIFGLQYYIILKLIAASLLFALFANTAKKLENEGKYIWKYQRYELITHFTNRLTLPPPLCLITFACMLGEYVFEKSHALASRYVFKGLKKRPRARKTAEKLDEMDFGYWKTLAQENHDESEAKKKSEMTTKKRMEQLEALTDALNEQRMSLRNLDGHLDELMLEIRNAHQYLEGTGVQATVMERLLARDVPQIFSRVSPYPDTVVERFPVSDNHVPWSCTWTSYDPISFTLAKEEYPASLAPYVDVNIQQLREVEGENFHMPSLNWNAISVSPGGVVTDRQSWMLDKSGRPLKYDIDSEGLPKNPRGRTGLRGRGCLPRWGPNHFVYVVITRWHVEEESTQYIDVVLYCSDTDDGFDLPGGYVHTEDRYEVVRSLFACEDAWKTAEDMEDFFRSHQTLVVQKSLLEVLMKKKRRQEQEGEAFSAERVKLGYLDEATNTDQAWCEAEVWHYHYQQASKLHEAFKPGLAWHKLSEQVLKELPIGQASLVYAVARSMRASLEIIDTK